MDSDSTAGSSSNRRHRSLPQVRVDPDFPTEPPTPSSRWEVAADAGRMEERSASSSSPIDNLGASFPLFFFGAGCVAVAAFDILDGTHAVIGRIPLWLPFLALGVIALAGGTLSVFALPDSYRSTPVVSPPTKPLPRRAPTRPAGARPIPARRPTPQLSPRPRSTPALIPEAAPLEEPEEISEAPPAPTAVAAAPNVPVPIPATVDDDTDSLLREIDQIDADLHGSKGKPAPTPKPTPSPPAVAGVQPARTVVNAGPRQGPSVAPPVVTPQRLESEAPRQVAHCVGCGSAILHSGTAGQCQVCGEPLCSDCRERSLSEGKPNLCPLCSLLDSVHSKGPATARAARSRT